MSTRRARIKAVAALPPRRKNVDNTDRNKPATPKPTTPKEPSLDKSPKTPRAYTAKSHEGSPALKDVRTPPPLLPIASVSKTPVLSDKITSPRIIIPTEATHKFTSKEKTSEKIPVITSASATNSTESLFASPLVRNSPDRRSYGVSTAFSPKSVNSREVQEILSTIGEGKEKHENYNASSTLADKRSDIPDNYSVPSVPESITDEAVMDGIVPLQTVGNFPKPIDLLKNEILSENAQVLFDPIVPLPSPSKVRLKLRPAPRLGPHRRNSIQGSASESEDESRRALLGSGAPTPAPPRQRLDSHTSHSTQHTVPNREVNRNRNDSVCSSVSQAMIQPPPATSPVKEKHLSKARRQEMGKRMWRRRRETLKRDALTMYDLIFYNPTTNPIIPDQDEIQAKEANAKEEAERNNKAQESEDDPDEPPTSDAAPVPQIKLGPNGEIILDEKSLVIKQSDANRKVSSVVREGAWGGSGGRYTRSARTAEWSAAETVRFYRALAAVGTDFSLMAQLFPDRTRKDLKLKFKKEERLNGAQVDLALRSATSWDVTRLQTEFKEERADAAVRAEKERERLIEDKKAERERMRACREMRIRSSLGAKALEFGSDRRAAHPEMTANEYVQHMIETRSQRKKEEKAAAAPRTSESDAPTNAPHFATLTLINKPAKPLQSKSVSGDMATISRVETKQIPSKPQESLATTITMPSNIENGSLVVLRVNDPSSPSKTMLQTYLAHGPGKLTPVALPSTLLNSVVGYMKMGTPKSTLSTASSPQLTSPSSVASQDSRTCTAASVIQLNPSPAKKQRHSSYNITQL